MLYLGQRRSLPQRILYCVRGRHGVQGIMKRPFIIQVNALNFILIRQKLSRLGIRVIVDGDDHYQTFQGIEAIAYKPWTDEEIKADLETKAKLADEALARFETYVVERRKELTSKIAELDTPDGGLGSCT